MIVWLVVSALVTGPFVIFGLYRVWLLVRLLRASRTSATAPAPADGAPARGADTLPSSGAPGPVAPSVTVQLPIYDERHVVRRLLNAVAALRYPRDRLEIQIVDDSTDDTSAIVRAWLRDRPADLHVTHVRRPSRAGYKAGALAHAAELATGELLAVFDADFVPGPDFLERVVPRFDDPRIGMVQCRWSFLNGEASALTRAQAVSINAHFGIEHVVYAADGSFFNFNGTAGIWRREAIRLSGGWSADTLTEDLDLSYRAQLAGWRFRYADDVRVPSEVPPTIRAVKLQQLRWSKGMSQVARKLLPRVLRAPLPLRVKIDATFHLLSNAGYVFVCAMAVVLHPVLFTYSSYLRAQPWWPFVSAGVLVTNVAAIGAFLCVGEYTARTRLGSSVLRTMVTLPISAGMAVTGAIGAVSGWIGGSSPFDRTPKYAQVGTRPVTLTDYDSDRPPSAWVELALFVYHLVWLDVALGHGRYDLLLLSAVFLPGFGYVAGLEFLPLVSRALVNRTAARRATRPIDRRALRRSEAIGGTRARPGRPGPTRRQRPRSDSTRREARAVRSVPR